MKAWEKWAFNLLALAVSASGSAYLWMKYGLKSDDPFAVVNHPWQPWMLAVHVFTAPWLLVLFGVLLNSHILRPRANGTAENRRSGWVSLAAFAGMTASGYGLQVATAPRLREAMLVLHLASSGLFVVAYGAHLVITWRQAHAPQATAEPERGARAACGAGAARSLSAIGEGDQS